MDSATAVSRHSAFAHREFRLYQGARLFMTLGAQMQSVAVGFHIYSLTHRPRDLGYVGLAQFLPMVLLSLVTGIVYFTFASVGASMSVGLAILIIGVPFFLLFIGVSRIIALAEGRIVESMLGTRMPRRPVHPGPPASWYQRIVAMSSGWSV